MRCNNARNKAAFSCSWNVYILDTEFSHDRNHLWKCKRKWDTTSTQAMWWECVLKEWGLHGGSYSEGDFLSWGLSFLVRTRQMCAQTLPWWKSSFVWAVSGTTSGPPIPQSEREMVIRLGEMVWLWFHCHQKTVVAKWLGVEGRSSWPCDVSSPERLQRFNFSRLLLSSHGQLRPLFTVRLPLTVLVASLLRAVLLLLLRHFYLTQILHVRHAGLLFKKITFLLAFNLITNVENTLTITALKIIQQILWLPVIQRNDLHLSS